MTICLWCRIRRFT